MTLFLKTLKDIQAIVILGWSAGKVDIPYLKKIAESVSDKTEWEIYWHDDTALKTLKNAMTQLKIDKKFSVKYIRSSFFGDR